MDNSQRTRSPHLKLEEFLDCYLESDYKNELDHFSEPQLTGSIREDVPDEALRYLALVLLYAIEERVQHVSLIHKGPNISICGMIGESYYEVPTPSEEIMTALFRELKEMTGMDENRQRGKLAIGLRNDQIELKISSTRTDAGEEKVVIYLPPLA
jgi:hypothetical protein